MKILWFADPHLRGKNPIHRKDNFYESVMLKMQEVFDIAKKENVDYIICGGDIFHSPIVSLNICDDFIDLAEKCGIEVKSLIGNHDMFNCNWVVSSSTTLAHCFRRSALITHLDEIETEDTYIKGVDYGFNAEDDLTKDLFINKDLDKNKTNILAVHAMIIEKPLPAQVAHIVYKEVESNYDYILVGHNHNDMGIQQVGNTKIVGIGAICRLTISKNDCERIPKVLILDTKTKEEKIIKLMSVKPKEEVFDFAKIEEMKKFDNNIEKFISSLESAKVKGLNIRGVVKNIGTENDVEQDVINCVMDRIGEYEDKN